MPNLPDNSSSNRRREDLIFLKCGTARALAIWVSFVGASCQLPPGTFPAVYQPQKPESTRIGEGPKGWEKQEQGHFTACKVKMTPKGINRGQRVKLSFTITV